MSGLIRYAPIALPLLFLTWWMFVIRLLRANARLRTELDVPTGSALRASEWGSASINGLNAQGCAKIVEYADGYVIRMMWIFGGGKLWLPKQGLRVGIMTAGVPRRRRVVSGEHELVLFEALADFVGDTTDAGLVPSEWARVPGSVDWIRRLFSGNR